MTLGTPGRRAPQQPCGGVLAHGHGRWARLRMATSHSPCWAFWRAAPRLAGLVLLVGLACAACHTDDPTRATTAALGASALQPPAPGVPSGPVPLAAGPASPPPVTPAGAVRQEVTGRSLPAALAGTQQTFVAFSMQVAQAQVEEAVRHGQDFRGRQPELFYLGGITKPAAVIRDAATGDWILLGERDPHAAVLTLDDWVVALRARFLHPERDPGVTIDPLLSAACQTAGTPVCRDSTRQAVRFFGGIERTHFGQVCYEADWLLKKLALALERVPVPALTPYYTLAVDQARRARAHTTRVGSRFWFYPIVDRVNVVGDVVLLEQMQLGVFTEVLYAEVNGQAVQDIQAFNDYPSEGFARSLSEHYDAVAQARDVLETLRGLTRLAALAKGLTQVDIPVPVAYYLRDYPVQPVPTPQDVEVLRVQNREVGIELAGGARLMALVLRVQGGDTQALRDLVLQTRPTGQALRWDFAIERQEGHLTGVRLPEGHGSASELASLLAHAFFLYDRKHYEAAIEGYTQILQVAPALSVVYTNRGAAYVEQGDYAQALADFTQALALNPRDANAYYNRGVSYVRQGDYVQALADFTQALALNPQHANAYQNRGMIHKKQGNYTQALADFAQAQVLTPQDASLYTNRGGAYAEQGNYAQALADFAQALALNPHDADAYQNRGVSYALQGRYEQAAADYSKALQIDPRAATYRARAMSYARLGYYERAWTDVHQAERLGERMPPNFLQWLRTVSGR